MNVAAEVDVEALPAIAVKPACFGIPFSRDEGSAECQACRAPRLAGALKNRTATLSL